MPPIHDVRLRWRSVILLIAGHLDSKVPLTRVVCWALDQLPSAALPTSTMVTTSTDSNSNSNKEVVSSPSESLQKEASSIGSGQMHHHRYHQREVVMDIEAIKWCHPDQPSGPGNEQELGEKESCEQQRKLQPVIFVRYAVTDSTQESNLVDREAIDNSAKELSDEGISQKHVSCSMDEVQHVVSLLQAQETCVDEAYRTQWKEKSALNGMVFRLSLLRPTLEPLFPHRTAKLKRRAERQALEVKRIEQLARRQRREERMLELQNEEQLRKDELQMRLDRGEVVDRVCSKPGCEDWALLQCSRCPNACYCRIERKSIGSVILFTSTFVTLLCVAILMPFVLMLSFNADQREDWLQRHGEVCLSERHVRCALAACNVNVLIGYTDPNRSFQMNEETTLCKKVMNEASGSAALTLRYFCSPTHCEEGKEEVEMTVKEYKCELARKESEVNRKKEEFKTDMDHLEEQSDESDQKIAELVVTLNRERANHELKLRELKTEQSRRPDGIEVDLKRETANLQQIFRKKELELQLEVRTLQMQKYRETDRLSVLHDELYEERKVFLREKHAGDETTLQEKLLDLQELQEKYQKSSLEVRESLRAAEEYQLSVSKELDTINDELSSKNIDIAAAITTAADPGPVKTPTEQPECVKATSSKKEGLKEGPSSKVDRATELARRERELDRIEEDFKADYGRQMKKEADDDQKIVELEKSLQREREEHELKLREIKIRVYKSKRPVKEMVEVLKRETATLQQIFRKKELENEQERMTIELLKLRERERICEKKSAIYEEREVLGREKFAGDKETLETLLLAIQEVRESSQKVMLSSSNLIRSSEIRQRSIRKELDAINAELARNDIDTVTATTSTADSGPVKAPTPIEHAPVNASPSTSVTDNPPPPPEFPSASLPSEHHKVTSSLDEKMMKKLEEKEEEEEKEKEGEKVEEEDEERKIEREAAESLQADQAEYYKRVEEQEAELKRRKDAIDSVDRKMAELMHKLQEKGFDADGKFSRETLTEEEKLVVDRNVAAFEKCFKLRHGLTRDHNIKKYELDIVKVKYNVRCLELNTTILLRKIDHRIENVLTGKSCDAEHDEEQIRKYQDDLIETQNHCSNSRSSCSTAEQLLRELIAEGEGDVLVPAASKPPSHVPQANKQAAVAVAVAAEEDGGMTRKG